MAYGAVPLVLTVEIIVENNSTAAVSDTETVTVDLSDPDALQIIRMSRFKVSSSSADSDGDGVIQETSGMCRGGGVT